jgi:hypothetical protein
MKTRNYIYAVLLIVFAIEACSAPVHVAKDDSVNLKNYKTYMWVDTYYNENDKEVRPAAYRDIIVKNAANTALTTSGWREVSKNPDVLISFDLLVENTTARRADPVYSQSYTRMYYNPRLRRWGSIYYPSEFLGYNNYNVPVTEGTVTITLTDADTDKIVWQGWTTEALNYSRITQEELTTSVKNIFSKLNLTSN